VNLLKESSLFAQGDRKIFVDKLVDRLITGYTYDLNYTFSTASKKIIELAKDIRNTCDLFDLQTAKALLSVCDKSKDIHNLISEYFDVSLGDCDVVNRDIDIFARLLHKSIILKASNIQLEHTTEDCEQTNVWNVIWKKDYRSKDEELKKAKSIMCKRCTDKYNSEFTKEDTQSKAKNTTSNSRSKKA
jgi:hypothetical protein